MKLEHTSSGKVELRLSGDPDDFKRIANAVRERLGGQWRERLDDFDQSYWDLDVGGEVITVHREHFLGVSVFCEDQPAKVELLEQLRRVFGAATRQ